MMNDSKLCSMIQIENFLQESEAIKFQKRFRKEAYSWVEEILQRFHYVILSKVEKGLIKRYLRKVTGYSKSQLTRLINQYHQTGQVRVKEYERNKFKKRYTPQDIRLLAKTAQLHDKPNGVALKKILKRMAREYGQEEYQNIVNISVSHIYNLKKKVPYLRSVSSIKRPIRAKEEP